MKTFSEFQESVASIALKGGIKLLPKIVKVAPKLKTFTKFSTAIPVGLGIAGALKSKKEDEDDIKGDNQNRPEYQLEPGDKTVYDVKPENLQDFPNQKDYLDKVSKDHEARKKKEEQEKEKKSLKNFRQEIDPSYKANRKSQGTQNRIQSQKARDRENKARRERGDPEMNNEEVMASGIPTNNVGGGKIAGTVEAGDDPPVKKKKKKKGKKKTYAYGGRGSRKMWMA